MPIRGLIFDFDGTILDTETPALRSWEEVFEEHGRVFPFESWAAGLGGDGAGFDACAHLEQLLGRPLDRETIRTRRNQRKLALTVAGVVLPGIVDCLDAAGRMGLKRAIASSSPRAWVEEHLARLGLLQVFDAISCRDDVCRVKPNPALYTRTLDLLGLRADEAIVIEDSPNGIAAARAAGIFCVVVPNPLTCRLPVEQADLRLASLAEITLEGLLTRVPALLAGG